MTPTSYSLTVPLQLQPSLGHTASRASTSLRAALSGKAWVGKQCCLVCVFSYNLQTCVTNSLHHFTQSSTFSTTLGLCRDARLQVKHTGILQNLFIFHMFTTNHNHFHAQGHFNPLPSPGTKPLTRQVLYGCFTHRATAAGSTEQNQKSTKLRATRQRTD